VIEEGKHSLEPYLLLDSENVELVVAALSEVGPSLAGAATQISGPVINTIDSFVFPARMDSTSFAVQSFTLAAKSPTELQVEVTVRLDRQEIFARLQESLDSKRSSSYACA
jgi:hypothetical protein